MNELANMTTEEAREAFGRARLAVLPTGSLEQHGPHLPLDTDAAVADRLARKVVAELGDTAVLCPLLPYGLSEHHMGFAGTITLRAETYLAVIADILESLHEHGINRVLIVNGHGGNIAALHIAASKARRDLGMIVASAMWSIVAADVAASISTGGSYGHACEVETSLALSLMPERVRSDRLATNAERRSVDPRTDPPAAIIDVPIWFDEWSDDGALGRPLDASPEAGRRLTDAFVDRVAPFARNLMERDIAGEPSR